MRLHIADDNVHAGIVLFSCCFQHGIGFSHSGGIAEKNLQRAPLCIGFLRLHVGQQSIRIGPILVHGNGLNEDSDGRAIIRSNCAD